MKLKTLVSIVLLIVIMVFFFCGRYYQKLGNTVEAVIMTLIFLILMGGLLWGATAARQREGAFSSALKIIGVILGIVYIIVGMLYIIPVSSHFFYVNNEKHIIQTQADTIIARTNDMLSTYKKMANNRALRLEQDIIKSQYTNSGISEFREAYPNKAYNSKLPSNERIAFGDRLLSTFNNVKKEWETYYEPAFSDKLAHNWSVFYSVENARLLKNIVKDYSSKLQETYQKSTSPFERLRGEQPTFENQVSADYIVEKFENSETSGVWNIVLVILLFLSAASFVFVQNTHVKKQRKNDKILDLGYDL